MSGPGRAGAAPDRAYTAVRRAIVAMLLSALVAFAVVGTGSVWVAHAMAERAVLDAAVHSVEGMSRGVIAPLLPALERGDDSVLGKLDDATTTLVQNGSVVRIKIWSATGTVLYSSKRVQIGQRFAVDRGLRDAVERGRTSADVSNLEEDENVDDQDFKRLVQVYVPVTLPTGTRLALEAYISDEPLQHAKNTMTTQLQLVTLGALLVLVLTQLPVAARLLRGVGRAHVDRLHALDRALAASQTERRTIARDLHDGVVQDLAGAGYALDAGSRALHRGQPTEADRLVALGGEAVRRSVQGLRSMIVDLYPPDLSGDNLEAGLRELGEGVRESGPTAFSLSVDRRFEPTPEVAVLVYRCARECLTNVVKHAGAQRVSVDLVITEPVVRLTVADDGTGLRPGSVERRHEGHVGLSLLAEDVRDAGGQLTLASCSDQGTTVRLVVPTASRGSR